MTKNIVASMLKDVRFKRLLQERLEVNHSATFINIVQDTVNDELRKRLKIIQTEMLNGTELVDAIDNNIKQSVTTHLDELQEEVLQPISGKLTEDQFNKAINLARVTLESIFNSLSEILILPNDVQEAFKEVLYNKTLKQDVVVNKLKFILNQIMSNYSSGYSPEIIKAKNELIQSQFKKLFNQVTDL